jgi:tetratricopeptide (TPR) repeat protein
MDFSRKQKKQIDAHIFASVNDRTAHPFARAQAFLSKTLSFVRRLRLSRIWAVENHGFECGIVARGKKTETVSAPANSSCELALLPHKGIEQIDREIRQLQHEARTATKRGETIKRLGWAFITKARLSYDPGYYKLAEQRSFCVQSDNANDPDAFLLQGHILDSLHKFKEAELVARKLVTIRNEALDHGLLGDVLMEQGRLDEAVVSYQKMINLRPDLQSYTRVANIRWLKGDLQGATAVMQMAVTGGSPREPEPTAWAYTRLGIYEFQAGNTEAAAKSAGIALQWRH